MASPRDAFTKQYEIFCGELRAAFPELVLDTALFQLTMEMHIAQFWTHVKPFEKRIEDRDEDLITSPDFQALPGVSLATIWPTAGDANKDAIWKHIRILYLLAKAIHENDDLDGDDGGLPFDIGRLIPELSGAMPQIQAAFDNIGKVIETMVNDPSGAEAFTLPEEIKNSSLFRLAEEIFKEFSPRDIGIESGEIDNLTPEQLLSHVTRLYSDENARTRILGLLQRIAVKIGQRIQNGAITREGMMADASRFVEFLRTNPALSQIAIPLEAMFTQLYEKFQSRGASDPHSHGKAVEELRERMRKRNEERARKEREAAAVNITPEAIELAEAVAKALEEEEKTAATKATKKTNKKKA